MGGWPKIPQDAIDWFSEVLAVANREVTELITNNPNIRETTLDDALINSLHPRTAPVELASGTIVHIQVHNIGGLRRWGSWETADVAVLVRVYDKGKRAGQKIGLLQSKRLFPANNDVIDEDEAGFLHGMNPWFDPEPTVSFGALHRLFEFNPDCTYSSLRAGSDQVKAIEAINARLEDAVAYLFYNPDTLPLSVEYPLPAFKTVDHPEVGCRVHSASDVHDLLEGRQKGESPTFLDIENSGTGHFSRLEEWGAKLLQCHVGKQLAADDDTTINELIVRRSGPIAAAIYVSISLDGTEPRPD